MCAVWQVALCVWAAMYAPPPEYRQWHRDMIQCSQTAPAIPFDALRFVMVADTALPIRGRLYVGYADVDSKTIYVVRDSVRSRRLVSHELLHTILGRPGHPTIPFTWPCHVE